MGLKLKNALCIYPFSKAQVIVGAELLDREITAVNIIEVPTVSLWMKGGELLFTSGFAFQGDMAFACSVLEDLAAKNIAALVIKPGVYMVKIPDEIIACAERLKLPILQIPQDMPYMAAMQPIMEKLIDEQILIMKHIEAVHNSLISTMLSDGSLHGISTQLSALVHNRILLLDTQRKVLASSERDESRAAALAEAFFQCSDASVTDVRDIPSHRLFRLESQEGVSPFIVVPINVDRVRSAYLIMEYNGEEDIQNYDSIALEHAGMLYSLVLQQHKALLEKEWQLKGECLDDLIWGNYQDDATILNRASLLGVDLTQPYFIASISNDQNGGGSREKDLSATLKATESLQAPIRRIMNTARIPTLMYNKGSCIVFLAVLKDKTTRSKVPDTLRDVLNMLERGNPDGRFLIGVSKTYNFIQKANTAYKESLTAIRCGKATNENKRIIYFGTMGVFRFLAELQGSDAMKSFYDQHIGPLLAYDTEKNGDLILTLKTYFDCNCNIRQTSDTLFLHKNSIIYRLHKIEQLTGHDLSDSESAFQLQLCLKLKSIL